ncbi:hypothetical protein BC962_3027 [Gillisia mitskevichiae]|uniref:Uncharacterized protein n=1 Tax=Gillisia mitskevichiae TaxID=270921 RepID=A0A495P455_9FLAO|nr:hypothetical protein [Gillisia mitskevichiae]RKS43469.1 hypothetical protein BC962_3027 [Gillisia mitskevichiae]
MTTYYSKSEITAALKLMVANHLKKCIAGEEISNDFIDLIKYNYSAKYVSFNKKKLTIEIGVEDINSNGSYYPVINPYSFPLKEKENPWLDKSFKFKINDFAFYGSLLNRVKFNHDNTEIIVI